jgi:hypothetical protein
MSLRGFADQRRKDLLGASGGQVGRGTEEDGLKIRPTAREARRELLVSGT